MHPVTKAILNDNRGRDPLRVEIKLAALRADPFAFYRGTSPLFYRTLELHRSLRASPSVLTCGDLHLQNFGSYKGDNRLVYFDINDFDESCVAPAGYELVRFVTSILVAAGPLGIDSKVADSLVSHFIEAYAANILAKKPRWVERPLATGPVRTLLLSLRGRHRRDLIKARTHRVAGKRRLIIDGKRTVAASSEDRARAKTILAKYARTQPSPAFYKPIDIALRIAGNGSLGLERYVALVQGKGRTDAQYLIDIKRANPSALAANIRFPQPRWTSEAARVATLQSIMQGISPALLGAVSVGKRSYLIKEMQPTADRVNLLALKGNLTMLSDVIRTMAEVTAWGQLRGCGRHSAASVDALAEFAAGSKWRRRIKDAARASHKRVMRQWQAYAADYDANPERLYALIQK